MNNENIQHTINATDGERQLSIVGNNFKEKTAKFVKLLWFRIKHSRIVYYLKLVIFGKTKTDLRNMEEIGKLQEEFKLIAERQILASLARNKNPKEFELATKEYIESKQKLDIARNNSAKYLISFLYSSGYNDGKISIAPHKLYHYSLIDTDISTEIDFSENQKNDLIIAEISVKLSDSLFDFQYISDLKIKREY